ncbi:MAG: hypothetical protein JW934_16480 [Anaerolineae bacterium]|nr:hypothetical protein [Anaerolineae bacterium]
MQNAPGEPPAVGRTITLFAPVQTQVVLGPVWAALCGALSSNSWQWQAERLLTLLLVLFVAEGLWSAWRAILVDIDWAALAADYPMPAHGDALTGLPYMTPWSPVGRLIDGWGRLRRWAQEALPHAQGSALMTLPYLPPLALAISALLGRSFLILSLLALALASLEWFIARRQPWHKSMQAIVQMGLSWLAGHLVFAPLNGLSLTLACAYALTYQGMLYLDDHRCKIDQRPWALGLLFGGQVLAAGTLALKGHTVAALLLGLLFMPQLLLLPQLNDSQTRARFLSRAAPFLGVAMAVAAWAI